MADDHPVVRSGLVSIVNAQADLKVIAEAEDGRAAVDQFCAVNPDIALIDLQMPKLDGVSVIREIRSRIPDAKLILFTTYDTDDDIQQGLRAGAKAYLLKDVRPPELLQCIRDVFIGKHAISSSVGAKIAASMMHLQLTSRELEVLRAIGEGLANKEIGAKLHIAESTVKLHVKTLFEKLAVTSRTEAMKIGIARGLIRNR